MFFYAYIWPRLGCLDYSLLFQYGLILLLLFDHILQVILSCSQNLTSRIPCPNSNNGTNVSHLTSQIKPPCLQTGFLLIKEFCFNLWLIVYSTLNSINTLHLISVLISRTYSSLILSFSGHSSDRNCCWRAILTADWRRFWNTACVFLLRRLYWFVFNLRITCSYCLLTIVSKVAYDDFFWMLTWFSARLWCVIIWSFVCTKHQRDRSN